MPDTHNHDLVLQNGEDYAVIANSEPKVTLPLAGQRSDIAGAGLAVFGKRGGGCEVPLDARLLAILPERIPAR
jgi:hypothetical protein